MQFKKFLVAASASTLLLVGCGANLSADAVKTYSQDFINNNLLTDGVTAEVTDVELESGVWRLKVALSSGLEVEAMMTRDGKYFIPEVFDVEEIEGTATGEGDSGETLETSFDLPKSARPEVELFVMSHCPYGTQVEKAILPAVAALDGTIDFKVRFVYYTMHGETEVREELRQYVIQQNYPEKYLDYLAKFLEAGDSEAALAEVGLTQADLAEAIALTDREFSVTESLEDEASWLSGRYPLFDIDKAANEEYGVGGSPTLVVNGQIVEGTVRSPAGMLAAICAGFENEPEVCTTELDTTTAASGFGYDGSGSSDGSCG